MSYVNPKKGSVQKKILLLLAAGIALSVPRSPIHSYRIITTIADEWKKLNQNSLRKAIKSLYRARLLDEEKNKDGTVKIVLSKKGKTLTEFYSLDDIKIPTQNKWDRNWRIVTFDIPERLKKVREAMRYHLKYLGFFEFQKSVFILPYPCTKEIGYVIDFYNARKYVRIIIAHSIDNELDLKKKFGL